MLWFIAALAFFALSMFYKKSDGNMGKLRFFDGEITEVNFDVKEVKVRYTVDGNVVEAIAKENYGDFSKLRPGTKVLVTAYKNLPQTPLNVTYNTKGKSYNFKTAQSSGFILAVACFAMGIISLFG